MQMSEKSQHEKMQAPGDYLNENMKMPKDLNLRFIVTNRKAKSFDASFAPTLLVKEMKKRIVREHWDEVELGSLEKVGYLRIFHGGKEFKDFSRLGEYNISSFPDSPTTCHLFVVPAGSNRGKRLVIYGLDFDVVIVWGITLLVSAVPHKCPREINFEI
ncbi:hypothetical protein IE077_000403 [Cardiosporidium cionae]|uniref:UBL3-like ubiquitin domain-containing protein n=1 Tax=Cardiosporidium cionae TaxID=476202 RepID=A0ABQ7JA66_9APIC|nr:hypothetical protein IE077_000403 [Cardiosporidium cionae]|eukprot:KAF8820833.1 hypothetical protein IE077_000403 [Cardiosporidium cionae]